MKVIKIIYTCMHRARKFLLFLFLLLMVLNISVGVFFRYVLGSSLRWTYELARYSMVWFSFLGMSLALKQEKHVGITIIINQFPTKIKKAIYILVNILVAFFLAVLFYYSLQHLETVSYQTSPALGINMRWPYLAVSVGTFLMLIESLRLIYLSLKRFTSDDITYLDRRERADK